MPITWISLVMSLLFLISSFASAEEVFTLDKVLQTVRSGNPELLSAARRLDAVKSRKPQSYTLDKPVLTYERMTAPGMGGTGTSRENNLLLTQTIPFPSSLYWRAKVADNEIGISGQDYEAILRKVTAETKAEYANLFASNKMVELFKENIDIMKRLSSVAETKYSIGHATKSDVLKAQVELSKMINMRVVSTQDRDIATAKLNTLMNRSPQTPLAIADDYQLSPLLPSATDYSMAALHNNPSIKGMQLSVEQSGNSLSLAKSEYYPDIMLGYRRRNSTDPDMDKTNDFMFGFSLPLWFSKQRSMVEEAKAQKNASELELQNISNSALYETQEYFVRARTMRDLLELYKTNIIPQAEEALKTSESGYQSEKTDFMDLLDAQRTLLSFRLEYYQYLREYERQAAELEKTAGEI